MDRDLSAYEDVFASGGDPEPEDEQPAAAAVEQSPEVVSDAAPAQSEQTHEPVTPAPSREDNAFAALRQSERDRADALIAQARIEAVQQRDAEWQRQFQQQQQPQQEPPDMYADPEGWARHVQEQARAQVQPQLDQMQQSMGQMVYQNSLQMAAASRPDFADLYKAANDFAVKFPSVVADIQKSPNPGLAIIQLGESLRGGQPPAPAGLTPEIRRQVLAEEAARLASTGTPPRPTAPRGVGSTPAGHGNPNGDISASDLARLARTDQAAYQSARNNVFGR